MSGYLSSVPSFAEIVFAARTARGMTQAQFADAVGVSLSTIYEAEGGGRPSSGTVAKVAKLLGQKPADLVPPASVFSQSGPRKKRAARSVRPVLESDAIPTPIPGGDMHQLAGDETILVGFLREIGTQERQDLIRHAYRLWETAHATRKAKAGKT
jgi:transcriptional regulator with XRE-family HTH domain